ncbi:MAG: hypothetical protein DLM73_06065 [Chthoniobacterales bacterium]|nr:MAG: hypothetical protein DLM73_06065 [Chthoniobacterales bacterium]
MIVRKNLFLADRAAAWLIALAVWCFAAPTQGIILFRTGDPTANTTEPTGQLAGSGWQYEGTFGDFLGTAIAPHYFITAKHFGIVSDKFFYHGTNYTVVRWFEDSASDLRIFEVAETFPLFAPLYPRGDEVGQHLVVIGRGSRRGPENLVNGQPRGWDWGATDSVQRWGENVVTDIRQLSGFGEMLYVLFNQNGLPDEAHLSGGDSGGAVFLNDGGIWKLAALNTDVDGPFYFGPGGNGLFFAALYDERGRYTADGTLISGNAPVPSGFYSSRVSSRLGWIYSIIDPGLANIATRVSVGTGDRVSIAGFIIQGDALQAKPVAIRGLGPSIQAGGVPIPGRLADPVLELHDATGAIVSTNDNWRGAQATEIQNRGLAPGDEREAVIIASLATGNYTAVLRGAGGGNGIGLIEVYDLDQRGDSRLVNLSARGFVGTGNDVLIGGLIGRSVSKRLLLRALGPELAAHGVAGQLIDPALELHDANGAILSANDNWRDAPNSSEIAASGLAPSDDRESAILVPFPPGAYTAIVHSSGEAGTGVALLEAYLVN